MDLYILRHAIAVDRGTPGYEDDPSRPLTPDGIRKMRRAAKGIRALGPDFDGIWTSPWRRAAETADIVARALEPEPSVQRCDALVSGVSPDLAIAELRKRTRKTRSVLIVGHEPQLSGIVSMMLAGHADLDVRLKKGGICKLECARLEPGAASLIWLLTPGQLRRLSD